MLTEVKVTNSWEAKRTLNTNGFWCEEIDDVTVEVFLTDKLDIVDLLADTFLLQDLVDFANQKHLDYLA